MRILLCWALINILCPMNGWACGKTDEMKTERAAQSRTPAVIRKGPVRIERKELGAIFTEDFESSTINKKRWRIWQMDAKQTSVTIKDGRLVIDVEGQVSHNGLWSLPSVKYKDVTLVARFGIQSEGKEPHELLLHLCGGDSPRSPDHWVEIAQRDQGHQTRFGVGGCCFGSVNVFTQRIA